MPWSECPNSWRKVSTSSKVSSELDLSNPLLAEWDTPHATPPFSRIELKDYEPAFDAAIACSRAEVEAIVRNPRKPTS